MEEELKMMNNHWKLLKMISYDEIIRCKLAFK